MKITVCVRMGLDGEPGPFDAAAYEEALRITDAEITLLSMGPPKAKDLLSRLSRLGASRAVLLSDAAFAGADTLATAYTLSRAIARLSPDLILCGRKTLVGDTAQTGAMLSVLANTALATDVMQITHLCAESVTCRTREENARTVPLPALLTLERVSTLRRPSLRSRPCEVEIWGKDDIDADADRLGLCGSTTRVIETHENTAGRRHCKFIPWDALPAILAEARTKQAAQASGAMCEGRGLDRVYAITDAPVAYARTVSENVTVLPLFSDVALAAQIEKEKPDAVLWGSDTQSRETAARVAARLGLGLCADCTRLETDGETLFMIRPALAGSVIAKIKSLTAPAMATVRTTETDTADVIVAAGYGAKDALDTVRAFAARISASLAATRKAVDNDLLPYAAQVGLTGKTVSPALYLAVGVSGAVHHLVGMERAGTVVAINPDKSAPIFDYADYGILGRAEELTQLLP